MLSSYNLSTHGLVVDPQAAKEVYKLRLVKDKLSMQDRTKLVPAMQRLCEGLPIVKVEEVDVTEEEYRSGSLHRVNSTNLNTRRKRSEFITCGGETSDRCTDAPINGGQYCRWYTCQTRNIGGECNLEHIRSGSWKCTVCCRPYRDGNMCKCDEVRDEESFVRCQGDLLESI